LSDIQYAILDTGFSRSFPGEHALLGGAAKDLKSAHVVIVIGEHAGRHAKSLKKWKDKAAVLIELGTESLGVYTGENRADEGSNVLGFARFRLGDADPTNLVELVRQPRTVEAALAAARELFEGAGLQVAVCGDFAGRIIDRLLRPYYNAALRRLDEGLATADDLDTTLRLGLGYPEGPIALLERTGLAQHFDVTQALFESYGEQPYAPARRARVAKQRVSAVRK
jgi:3-hydroxybutyryl-CoA dehydrogenase